MNLMAVSRHDDVCTEEMMHIDGSIRRWHHEQAYSQYTSERHIQRTRVPVTETQHTRQASARKSRSVEYRTGVETRIPCMMTPIGAQYGCFLDGEREVSQVFWLQKAPMLLAISSISIMIGYTLETCIYTFLSLSTSKAIREHRTPLI